MTNLEIDEKILREIKSKSWNTRTKVLADNSTATFISTYKINDMLSEPKDWNAIATKCSVNHNHEHFGKSPEEILEIWGSKSKKGADRGISLENYIHNVFTGPYDKATFIKMNALENELELLQKMNSFDKFYENFLVKNEAKYVGSEIWLCDYDYKLNIRLDSLFIIKGNIFVIDWKNHNNISTTNSWNNLLGPLSSFEATDAAKMSIQANSYRYILEKYFPEMKVFSSVLNITTMGTSMIDLPIKYDKQLMENVYDFAYSEMDKRSAPVIEKVETNSVENTTNEEKLEKPDLSKNVFILNGKPTSGKDQFCLFVEELGNAETLIVKNISSVDKVKESGPLLGWTGTKTDHDRNFLSDLKDLSTKYYDGPFVYAKNYIENENFHICFVHIREFDEIEKLKTYLAKSKLLNVVKTVYMERDVNVTATNHADTEIEKNKSKYDMIIDNTKDLANLKSEAELFIKLI